MNNPVKYIDPDGKAVETALDLFNVGLDVSSFCDNVQKGNAGGAVVDGLATVAAVCIPCVPGGAGAGLKVYRMGNHKNLEINLKKWELILIILEMLYGVKQKVIIRKVIH